MEAPAPEQELLPLSEEGAKACKAALRLLKFRARSAAELRARLVEKEFTAEAVDEAMDRVDTWKLLDDAEFARQWVEQRSAAKGATRSLLRRELEAKGVAPADMAPALESVSEHEERARAHDLAAERLRRYEAEQLADRETMLKAKRRLVAYLQRRGYSSNVALSVVDTEIANAREFL